MGSFSLSSLTDIATNPSTLLGVGGAIAGNMIAPGIGGAVVGGLLGSSIGGGISGANAAEEAAALNRQGTQAGIDESARQFDITQEQYKPYREAGARGLSKYESLMNKGYEGNPPESFSYTGEDFAKGQDPGYQFRADTQTTALDRMMAKRGQRGGGARYRGLMELSGKLASQEFGAARGRAFQDYSTRVSREQEQYQRNYLTPLSNYASLAGIGGSATQQLGGLRSNYATNVSNAYGQMGATDAAGVLGQQSAMQGMFNNFAGIAGMAYSGGMFGGAPAAGATNVYGGGGMPNVGSNYQNNPLTSPMRFGSGVYQ